MNCRFLYLKYGNCTVKQIRILLMIVRALCIYEYVAGKLLRMDLYFCVVL